MNKYIALSLLGAANAANAPLPDISSTTTFPKYPTVVALVTGDKDTNNIKLEYQQNTAKTVNYGYYVAIRNGLAFGITQSLKAHASGDQTLAATSASGTRSFYQTSAAMQGTMWGKATLTTASTCATGAAYALCETASVEDPTKCNGGVKGFKGASGTLTAATAVMAYRVVSWIGISSKGNATYLWKWNNDVLLASVMQTIWTGTTATEDGTKWCSDWKVTLAKAGTAGSGKATNGLTGKSKCTFQFLAEDYTVAPTITISKADYVKALVQWVEWLDTTALGTNAVLPAATGANYFIGDYATTGGVFLNPLTDQGTETKWLKAVYTVSVTEKDPSTSWAGSRGKASYYSRKAGVFSDTQISSIESGAIINSVNYKVDENNKYNSVKSTYESDKTKYNDAVTKENARLKDIFKAAFDPAVTIPTRPNNPSPPASFNGPYLALDKIISSSPTAWELTAAKQQNAAYIKFGTGVVAADYQAATKYATRLGYICMTSDDSKVGDTTTLASSGHVWGRLGQGTNTLTTGDSPFYYGKTATGQIPGLMVSLLPNAPADTGLAASGKQIVIDAKARTFDTTTYNAPGQPSKSSEPMDPPAGAKMLSASIAAATLIAATLY